MTTIRKVRKPFLCVMCGEKFEHHRVEPFYIPKKGAVHVCLCCSHKHYYKTGKHLTKEDLEDY